MARTSFNDTTMPCNRRRYSWRLYADANTTCKMKTRAMPDVIVS